MKVWVPKSQIENGKISEWIAGEKQKEMIDFLESRDPYARVLDGKINYFFDAQKNIIHTGKTKKELKFAKERQKRIETNRAELAKQAKANGWTVRKNLKTSTLRAMASEKKPEPVQIRYAPIVSKLRKQG